MMKKNVIPAVILVIAAGVFIYSAYMLLGRQAGLNKGGELYEDLSDAAVTVSDEATSVSEQNDVVPVEVDFDSLENKNIDSVAWILSEGTPINYPVMQADDNDYYLRRLPDGTSNICGSIFMDYRCGSDFSLFNTIIYGHSFYKNPDYFGTLANYADTSYYKDHKLFYIITPKRAYTCRVFAGFVTDGVSSVFNIPETEEEIADYLNYVYSKSDFESDVTCEPTDHIVVLSTCSYARDNARYVVFAKLN